MTNLELIEKFKDNPYSRLSSSYFRSLSGILFSRVPKGAGRAEYFHSAWYPIYVHGGDIGLMNHFDPHRLPTRQAYRVFDEIRSISQRMTARGKTVITIDNENEIPFSMHQPLKLRNVPDRKKFIKNILNYYFSTTLPRGYSIDYRNSSKLEVGVAEEEAYKVAWEYAITTFAEGYVKKKKVLESSLGGLCSGEHLASLNQAILTLSNQVKEDDLDNCEDTFVDLHNSSNSFASLISGISATLARTRAECRELTLNAPIYMENDRRDLNKLYSNYYVPKRIMSISNNNLLKGWGDFSSFISELGFDIPKPFGINLNAENVATLAAFRDTSAESMLNFTHHLDKIVEAQEAEAGPSNLYLG